VAVYLADAPETSVNIFSKNPVGEEESGPNKSNANPSSNDVEDDFFISATRMQPSGPNNQPRNTSNKADESDTVFGPPHEHSMAKIDHDKESINTQDAEVGLFGPKNPPSSDQKKYTHADPDEEPCLHEHVHDLGYCNDCGEEVPL